MYRDWISYTTGQSPYCSVEACAYPEKRKLGGCRSTIRQSPAVWYHQRNTISEVPETLYKNVHVTKAQISDGVIQGCRYRGVSAEDYIVVGSPGLQGGARGLCWYAGWIGGSWADGSRIAVDVTETEAVFMQALYVPGCPGEPVLPERRKITETLIDPYRPMDELEEGLAVHIANAVGDNVAPGFEAITSTSKPLHAPAGVLPGTTYEELPTPSSLCDSVDVQMSTLAFYGVANVKAIVQQFNNHTGAFTLEKQTITGPKITGWQGKQAIRVSPTALHQVIYVKNIHRGYYELLAIMDG